MLVVRGEGRGLEGGEENRGSRRIGKGDGEGDGGKEGDESQGRAEGRSIVGGDFWGARSLGVGARFAVRGSSRCLCGTATMRLKLDALRSRGGPFCGFLRLAPRKIDGSPCLCGEGALFLRRKAIRPWFSRRWFEIGLDPIARVMRSEWLWIQVERSALLMGEGEKSSNGGVKNGCEERIKIGWGDEV